MTNILPFAPVSPREDLLAAGSGVLAAAVFGIVGVVVDIRQDRTG